ncbi:hypothetical protein B0H16DRAFT_1304151 [Mycena metata]|uniref:SnoaL-like domain-containing protein n=1 Tax=Mycena metata TaxID=1033252 RepID=A0AAD7JZQ7_9AGAR|nr:hypothetical protein B0H16DRAFT_1304151 [Mycena metata]
MAKFTLTHAHVASMLDPVAQGDWSAFVAAIDPDVRWVIGSEKQDKLCMTGVYTLATWNEQVRTPLAGKLKNGEIKMVVSSFDVVGNKAIAQASGEAVQLNGKPYVNHYAWFLTFSEDTGKVVEIREYLDTALLYEVNTTN